jgi:pre-mRNA-splicing factor ATP-dependent RNA helicase DHX16
MVTSNYVLLVKDKVNASSPEVEKESEMNKLAPAQDQFIDSTLPEKQHDQKAQVACENMDDSEQATDTAAETRYSLPIYAYRDKFLAAIEEFQVIIIIGETGLGKSTQLPQYLHEAGYTHQDMKIGVTQPNEVATVSVAQRVSEEMGHKLGGEVGYAIRSEDCTSADTLIKFMTNEHLLAEIMTSPSLDEYSVIMVDQAHQRTECTDTLLTLLKELAKTRPIKLLISSETFDAQRFSVFFDDAPIFYVPGTVKKLIERAAELRTTRPECEGITSLASGSSNTQ